VEDAKAVLAAFDVKSAHLVGSSVGGVVARGVALECPGLARSLTFIGSSPGDGTLPVWTPEYTEVALSPPGPSEHERVEYLVRELRVMSDDRFDEDVARQRAERCVRRGWTLDALRRVARAAKHRSLGERDLQLLLSITIPCLVIHGTADAVLGLDHGRMLARAVPGSRLCEVEGMGHDLQPHYVDAIATELLAVLARGDATLRTAGGSR
jgi:pimeloyl-ACP methyl ester carboxylesterase